MSYSSKYNKSRGRKRYHDYSPDDTQPMQRPTRWGNSPKKNSHNQNYQQSPRYWQEKSRNNYDDFRRGNNQQKYTRSNPSSPKNRNRWNENFRKSISREDSYQNRIEWVNLPHNVLISNLLKVECEKSKKLYCYPIIYPKTMTREEKSHGYENLKKKIQKDRKEIIVTPNYMICIKHVKGLENHVISVQRSNKIIPEEFASPFKVKIGEEYILDFDKVLDENDEIKKNLVILNEFIIEVLWEQKNVKEKFFRVKKNKSSFFREKEVLFDSFQVLDRKPPEFLRMSDYYVHMKLFQTISLYVDHQENNLFFRIFPGFKNGVQKFSPNGLLIIQKYKKMGYLPDDVNYDFKNFFCVSNFSHKRLLNRVIPIKQVRFDLSPMSLVSGTNKTFKDYFVEKFKYDEDKIRMDQPLIEVDIKEVTGCQFYLPQFLTVKYMNPGDRRRRKNKIFKKEKVDNAQKLLKMEKVLGVLRESNFFKKLLFYGLKITPPKGKSTNLYIPKKLEIVNDIFIVNFQNNIFQKEEKPFHNVQLDGSSWARTLESKMKLLKSIGKKEINFKDLVIIYAKPIEKEALGILSTILHLCKEFGVESRKSEDIVKYPVNSPREPWVLKLYDYKRKLGKFPKIIICVPLYSSNQIYYSVCSHSIKHGIVEQFVLADTIKKRNRRKLAFNLFCQIYCKLGGFLWGVSKKKQFKNVLHIGITYSCGKRKFRENGNLPISIGIVCASLQDLFTRRKFFIVPYSENCQFSSKIISSTIKWFVDEYEKLLKKKVEKIIIFRKLRNVNLYESCLDIKQKEINQIKRICSELVYICINNNHDTLFWSNQGTNPKNGSYIRTKIGIFDSFYLNYYVDGTRSGLQRGKSISKTSNYVIIDNSLSNKNEINLPQLCLELCCMYYNWFGVIHYPFVVQLAKNLASKFFKCCTRIEYKKESLSLNLDYRIVGNDEKTSKKGHLYEDDWKTKEVEVLIHKNSENGFSEL